MKCSNIKMGGASMIVCGSQRIEVCACGQIGTRLCDWKLGKGRTCDASICDDCTTTPAKNKDLCKVHAKMWETRLDELVELKRHLSEASEDF